LLSIQYPKTDYPDELIFIMYHQITELYFKLVLHELQQITHNGKNISSDGHDLGWNATLDPDFFKMRVMRIVRYFESLTQSFDIMVDGMEPQQFLKFRMALLPASGFQSAQYRLIEMSCCPLIHLVSSDQRMNLKDETSIETLLDHIYWNKGATELESGKKTLTLKHFESQYRNQFISHAKDYAQKTVWHKFKALSLNDQMHPGLKDALRQLDLQINVRWPLVHYKSAVRYLQRGSDNTPATGGTNWQKYLPPRFQKRIFFPDLWTSDEMERWGTF
jgi:tryptophan 2,3-dioxygenase